MSSSTPRRALVENKQRSRTPLLVGAVGLATVAVIATVATALNHDDQQTTGARPRASSCSSITVFADPAWAESVRQAGKAWGESLGQADCETVTVTEQTTATTLSKGLGSTDAWIPEDPSAIAGAKDPALAKAASTTVGSSPLVLVNTPEAHKALSKPLQGETPPTSLNTATPAQVDLTKAEQRIVDQVPLAQVTRSWPLILPTPMA